MNSRERVELTLNHREPDRVPLDLGGCGQTGMHVDTVYSLRQALGLDEPGTPVKVIEPYQMLGEIKTDLIEALGADVVGLGTAGTLFGFKNDGWKPWITFAGTPVLVPEGFNTELDENGDLYMYAGGDKSYPPTAKMPAGGFYFDSLKRQYPIDDDNLKVEDNLEEFGLLSDEDLSYLRSESIRLYEETDKAIMLVFPGGSFGDIAVVPGPMLKDPKGIRDVEEWYVSTVSRQDFIYQIFERQCDIALDNLERSLQSSGESHYGSLVERYGLWCSERAFPLAQNLSKTLYAPLQAAHRLDPHQYPMEGLYPLLWLYHAADSIFDRDGL